MKELMTAIFQQINSAHEYKTHNGIAPQTASYPYVVYKVLPVSPTEKDRDDYTLEVSCWDKSESTSHAKVVELAENVRRALLNFRHLDENNLIIVSRPNTGYIPDPDELIKRYDITATLMTYRRS
jgi:hypothetical protein